MGFFVKNRELKSGSTSVVVPVGDTSHRPLAPVPGQIRYNTDICKLEYFTGTAFRSVAAEGKVQILVDYFVGNNTATYGPMLESVETPEDVIVFVGSIYQIPHESYAVAGNSIVFTAPVPNEVPINIIHNVGSTVTEGCLVPSPVGPDVDQPENIFPGPGDIFNFGS